MVDPSGIVSPQKGSALSQSEHRQITVLMTDLVGFTAFVERMGEEAAFALVSQVSSLTTAAIHRHRGTVKNFTGDGILALFGTPTALWLTFCVAMVSLVAMILLARRSKAVTIR